MSHRLNRFLLLPLLAVCTFFAASVPVRAQEGVSASLQINLGSRPRWGSIRGTRVREIRSAERPDYDVYLCGGTYYAYDNDRWYSSRSGRGEFVLIDERFVPLEFSRIPREHWRHYPSAWMEKNHHDNGRRGHGRGHERDHDGDDQRGHGHDHK
ncbi:MAG TPA: hypothetical protein VI504_03200 [Candidatus Eisenbacteria bacterium]